MPFALISFGCSEFAQHTGLNGAVWQQSAQQPFKDRVCQGVWTRSGKKGNDWKEKGSVWTHREAKWWDAFCSRRNRTAPASHHRTVSCCMRMGTNGQKSGLFSSVLSGEGAGGGLLTDRAHLNHRGGGVLEWKWMRFAVCFDPCIPRRTVPNGIIPDGETERWKCSVSAQCFFFFLLLWLTAALLHNCDYSLTYPDAVMIEWFHARGFVPSFSRTLMSFSAGGSDGEWDVATPLQHPSLSPSQWPFRLQTLQRSRHRGSPLHLHHRSVSHCKRKQKTPH